MFYELIHTKWYQKKFNVGIPSQKNVLKSRIRGRCFTVSTSTQSMSVFKGFRKQALLPFNSSMHSRWQVNILSVFRPLQVPERIALFSFIKLAKDSKYQNSVYLVEHTSSYFLSMEHILVVFQSYIWLNSGYAKILIEIQL